MTKAWWGSLVVVFAACSSTESASVQLAMSRAPVAARMSLASAVPIELGVKITTAYLAQDIDAMGTNVGLTQAVYASPNCETFDTGGGTVDPNLGNCGLDIGLVSSSRPPQQITRGPDFIDLAAGAAAVDAALDAGRFSVDVGTYKYLRLDIGTNVPGAPPNGSQDTLPAGTAMNYRFRAGDMTAPYELRMLMGIDVVLDPPLELTADMSVRVELDYQIEDVITVRNDTATDPRCTSGAAPQYCLEPSRIGFVPRIVIE